MLFTVTAAGSLDQANGIPELIEAFRVLTQERFRLRILGGGPLEAFVRQAAAQDPRIEYAGVLPFDRVLDAYTSSDLLINMRITKRLSTRYFFPSKLLEYLASGVPVLTTCTGHVEEELGRYCVLLRDESPAALAAAIEQIAAMPPEARTAMGARARAFMAADKVWPTQGRRIVTYVRQTMFGTRDVAQRVHPLPADGVDARV
jgi:glycosyltransferase involved in cell wall biosynthesis